MAKCKGRFLVIDELSELLDLGENSLKLLALKEGLPLRRRWGVLELELIEWIKSHPVIGKAAGDKLLCRMKQRRR
jgi:hypothetical protein